MNYGIYKLMLLMLCLISINLQAQENDSVEIIGDSLQETVVADSILIMNFVIKPANPYCFKPEQLIIPVTLVGVGIIGLESDWLKYQNREVRDELQENIDKRVTIDDFSQYVPMAAVYGLNLCGIKGKHDFAERTIILATAYSIMAITVNGLKMATKIERPDIPFSETLHP